jgi:hypothetical protein
MKRLMYLQLRQITQIRVEQMMTRAKQHVSIFGVDSSDRTEAQLTSDFSSSTDKNRQRQTERIDFARGGIGGFNCRVNGVMQ